MIKSTILRFLLSITFLATTPSQAKNTSKLPKGFFPLAELSQQTLGSLVGDLIVDTNMVALGEPAHTSRDFYKTKIEIIKFLIEEKGFRQIAFEDSHFTIIGLNSYLLTKARHDNITLKSHIKKMYNVWQAEIIFEFFTWLKSYNQKNPNEMVSIFGFDIQNLDQLSDYLESRLDIKFRNTLRHCKNKIIQLDPQICKKCEVFSQSIQLPKNKLFLDDLSRNALKFEYKRICNYHDQSLRLNIRDEALYQLFTMQFNEHKQKTIIWSANGHIHKSHLGPHVPNGISLI